jgi:hypothetical protein
VLGLPNNTLPLVKRADKKSAAEPKVEKDEE